MLCTKWIWLSLTYTKKIHRKSLEEQTFLALRAHILRIDSIYSGSIIFFKQRTSCRVIRNRQSVYIEHRQQDKNFNFKPNK